jgi:hypothetical protein
VIFRKAANTIKGYASAIFPAARPEAFKKSAHLSSGVRIFIIFRIVRREAGFPDAECDQNIFLLNCTLGRAVDALASPLLPFFATRLHLTPIKKAQSQTAMPRFGQLPNDG